MNPGLNPKVARRDLYARPGDTFRERLTFVDTATGLPIDISLWVFESKWLAPDGSVLATLAFDLLDGPNGVTERSVSVPASPPPIGDHYMKATKSDGDVQTFEKGSVFFG